jgi:uncharacterized membrane protein YjgN (DUF898 family)
MSSSVRPPRRRGKDPNRHILILVLGILGVTTCAVLAPFAWKLGNDYERDCRIYGEEPEQLAAVGRILGMVGTALLVLGFVWVAIWLVVFAAAH